MNMADYSETPSIDKIVNLAGATIQHGPCNRRVYLMKLGRAKPHQVLPPLLELCRRKKYSKVFAKVPLRHQEAFHSLGFETEARVPRFFQNREAAAFLGLYLDPKRRIPKHPRDIQKVHGLAQSVVKPSFIAATAPGLRVRRCLSADIPAMAAVYGQVFESYPFPISNPEFLAESMASHVVYFGAWKQGHLVALASAETDREDSNAEMTDFATLPEHRGESYSRILLDRMERVLRQERIATAYTIARAISPGMNITFAKQGYQYAGCLINNTNICGDIESMNVWYRQLIAN
jgi:putative beta-lysine N-acetyltransferase